MQNSAKNTPSDDEEKNQKINPNDSTQEDSLPIDEDENSAVEDDGTPVLDEEDLEENNIDDEEAEDKEWEPPKEQ